MSVEVEVADLLTALVVALKPDVVVETGTGDGYSARAIGYGLQQNGQGHLWTVEISESKCERARAMLLLAGLADWTTVVNDNTPTNLDIPPIDMAFLDSNQSCRVGEALALNLSQRGVVLIHDTSPIHHVRETLAQLEGWQLVTLPTPRGLTIARQGGRRI